MKNLVEVSTKALGDNPEGVVVTEKQEGKTTVIEVHVSDNDMGKVIGKQGRIAKSIRTIVKAASGKQGKRKYYSVSIVEKDVSGDNATVADEDAGK